MERQGGNRSTTQRREESTSKRGANDFGTTLEDNHREGNVRKMGEISAPQTGGRIC